MNARPIVRPAPQSEEAILAWLTRLAAANALPHLAPLAEWLDVSLDDLHRGAIPPATLARRLAVVDRDLAALPHRHTDGQIRLGDLCLTSYDFRAIAERAICTECCRAGRPVDRLWDLTLYTVCHRHRRWLRDRCRCSARLTWGPIDLFRCARCEDSLLLDVPSASAPPPALTRLSWTVVRLVEGSERSLAPLLPRDDPAAFSHLVDMARVIAGYDSAAECERLIERHGRTGEIAVGLWRLVPWPEAFDRFLARVAADRRNPESHLPKRGIVEFGRGLWRLDRGSAYAAIVARYRQFVERLEWWDPSAINPPSLQRKWPSHDP